jgi:hypothetical protein
LARDRSAGALHSRKRGSDRLLAPGADLGRRRERWQRLSAAAGVEVAPTERGLRLVFRAAPGVAGELHELAELERECCAFADWAVSDTGGRVVLEVGGRSEEGVPAVRATFGDLRAPLAAPGR